MTERQSIEWKQSWHDDYLKWVCGFANAVGGTIYIGKDNEGNVVGLAVYKKLLEDIPNKIRNTMGIICDIKLKEGAGLSEPIIEEKNGGIAITLLKKDIGKGSEEFRSKFGRSVETTFNVIAENPEYTAEKIAQELNISPRTVEKH